MYINRAIWIQLATFIVVSLTAIAFMAFGYLKLPSLWFGVDRYTVTVQLPDAGGLYDRANVTYRGMTIGKVRSVHLTDSGVEAVLSLDSQPSIPADVNAELHSQSAVGEQYVALVPRSSSGPALRNGDVISRDHTSVPADINVILNETNRGLEAIPQANLKTVVDEASAAVGGLGPEIRRLVEGSTTLATDARTNLDPLTALIDQTAPVLNTQTETSDDVTAWAANLAVVTEQLKDNDEAVRGVIQRGGAAVDETRRLLDRLKPTLPVVLANLVSVGQVAVTYRADLEQLLVLLPQSAATQQAIGVPNRDTKQDLKGAFLSFNLNLNLPPPCTTGFLPSQQRRAAAAQDSPDRPAGDLYCRIPQDAKFNVRGARNIPCETKPGKRAPTAKMCESDEEYVPLNEGYNWKGDPNATLSGQPVPQPPPGDPSAPPPPPPPPIAVAEYDPATGTYIGPDGQQYTQSNLANDATPRTWQDLVAPPKGN